MKYLRAATVVISVALDFTALLGGILIAWIEANPWWLLMTAAAAYVLVRGAIRDHNRALPPPRPDRTPDPVDARVGEVGALLGISPQPTTLAGTPAVLTEAQRQLAAEDAAWKRNQDGLGDPQ